MTAISESAIENGVRAVTDEEAAFYRANGWVRLDGLLSEELVAEMLRRAKERMGEHVEKEMPDDRPGIMNPLLRALWKDWQNPAEEDGFFKALSQSPALGRVAGKLLRDRPVRWWSDAILCKVPSAEGGSRTPWHQDFPYLSTDRIGLMNIWVALVDIPPERGTMRFLNGSHKLGPMGRVIHRTDGKDLLDLYPWIEDEYELSAPNHLKPGDATVHDWMTVHAAPENSTDEPRWVYTDSLFPADTLFTGAQQRRTDGLGLTVNQPFDHPRFPLVYP